MFCVFVCVYICISSNLKVSPFISLAYWGSKNSIRTPEFPDSAWNPPPAEVENFREEDCLLELDNVGI